LVSFIGGGNRNTPEKATDLSLVIVHILHQNEKQKSTTFSEHFQISIERENIDTLTHKYMIVHSLGLVQADPTLCDKVAYLRALPSCFLTEYK
jgi:hypothetical protein